MKSCLSWGRDSFKEKKKKKEWNRFRIYLTAEKSLFFFTSFFFKSSNRKSFLRRSYVLIAPRIWKDFYSIIKEGEGRRGQSNLISSANTAPHFEATEIVNRER